MKLVSINIEGHKHLHERVIPFLLKEQPDVVCLQEVFAEDVPELMAQLKMDGQYASMADVTETSIHQSVALGDWGVLQLSKLPIHEMKHRYYVGNEERIPVFYENNDPNSMNRVFSWMTVGVGEQLFTVGTTHFTWSIEGASTPEQLRDLKALFKILETIPEIIFCGDFNAPRGRETFAQIAQRYHDTIPPEVTTSIDGQLHKAGPLELMVDGLFSSVEYIVSDVRVVGGVSDHKAIVAQVARA